MAQLGILMPSTHNMANNLQSMETHPCYPLLDSSDTRYAQATQTWRHNTHTKKTTKKKSLQFIKLEKSWDRSWFFKKLLCTYTIISEYMCVCVHLRVCQTKPHCKPAEVSEPLLRISTFIPPLPEFQGLNPGCWVFQPPALTAEYPTPASPFSGY